MKRNFLPMYRRIWDREVTALANLLLRTVKKKNEASREILLNWSVFFSSIQKQSWVLEP